MAKSLYTRILIPILVILAISLAMTGSLLSNWMGEALSTQLTTNLLTQARIASFQVSQLLETANQDEIKAWAGILARQSNTRVTLIGADGVVLAESSMDASIMDNHLSRPEVQAALTGMEITSKRVSNTLNQNMIYAAVPVRVGYATQAVLRLSVPGVTLEKQIAMINERLWWGGGILFLIVGGLLALLLESVRHPLRQLSTASTRDLSLIAQITARKLPFGELGAVFQALKSQFQEQQTQIEELTQERAALEAVLTTMTDGVLIVDSDGRVQLLNPAAERMFQISKETAKNQTLIEVVRIHQLVDLWRDSIAKTSLVSATLEVSAGRMNLQAYASPLDPALPGSTLMVFQDLTQIRRLELVRRDFVSNVSHELRTPLASIKALVETLQESVIDDPASSERFLKQMDVEVDNLTQIVQELLELSKIESGKTPLALEATSPYALISAASDRMEAQAKRSGINLIFEGETDLPKVMADASRIGQVFVNLIHNAIKFTAPGGSIVLSAKIEGPVVCFCVSDTGIGINAEDLPRIFERFYKADRARSSKGTGLGLSISRHLVEAHGGKIWAESIVTQGARFYFTIPIA